MTQSTPRPWHIGLNPGPFVYGPKGEQVADMFEGLLDKQERIANASLIVTAVNEYDALNAVAEALRETDELLRRASNALPLGSLVGFSDQMLANDTALSTLASIRKGEK